MSLLGILNDNKDVAKDEEDEKSEDEKNDNEDNDNGVTKREVDIKSTNATNKQVIVTITLNLITVFISKVYRSGLLITCICQHNK